MSFCSPLVECSLSRSAVAVASGWGTVAVLRFVSSGVMYMRIPIASRYGVFFMHLASLGTNDELL